MTPLRGLTQSGPRTQSKQTRYWVIVTITSKLKRTKAKQTQKTHRRTHEHTPFKLHTQNLSASKINGCLSTHTGNRQTARWGLSGENTIQDKLCEKKEVNGLHRFIETRSLYFWLKRPKLSEEAGRGPVPETQYVYDCFSGGCVS